MALPTKPPTVESTLPKHPAPEKVQASPDTAPKAPATKVPSCGVKSEENGGRIYQSRMIKVSRLWAYKKNPNALEPEDWDDKALI